MKLSTLLADVGYPAARQHLDLGYSYPAKASRNKMKSKQDKESRLDRIERGLELLLQGTSELKESQKRYGEERCPNQPQKLPGKGIQLIICKLTKLFTSLILHAVCLYFQAVSASITALGFSSAILSKARAGPSGLRRPCSQF